VLLSKALTEQEQALREGQHDEPAAEIAIHAFQKKVMEGIKLRMMAEIKRGTAVDEELEGLQQQILAKASVLAKYRKEVPLKAQEHLSATLQRLRPPVSPEVAGTVNTDEGQQVTEDKENMMAENMSPNSDELRARLQGAASKAPTLRAKLKECLDRMERVTKAVSAVQCNATPTTVERVLIGTPAPGKSTTNTAHTPVAESTPGDVLTRKRLLNDLKPIPYEL